MTEDDEAKQKAHEVAANQSSSLPLSPVNKKASSQSQPQDGKSSPASISHHTSPVPPASHHKQTEANSVSPLSPSPPQSQHGEEVPTGNPESTGDNQNQGHQQASMKHEAIDELAMTSETSNKSNSQTNQTSDEQHTQSRTGQHHNHHQQHRRHQHTNHNNNNNNNNNNNIGTTNATKRYHHHSNNHHHHQQQHTSTTGYEATDRQTTGAAMSGAQQATQPGGPAISAEYLAQLIKDKKHLASFPAGVFLHVPRLIDDEIQRVRTQLFQLNDVVSLRHRPLELPEQEGEPVALQEKIYVPVDEHPEYNFVGRILGPRGMTAKQLEQETDCKIMIRGKGSMRDKKKEEQNRGKTNWEHLNDDLHVLITVEDTPNRAKLKLERAIEEVKQLLVPIVDGEDELKKRQLMELAIINGTYRDSNYNETLSKMLNDAMIRQTRLTGGAGGNPHQEQPDGANPGHQLLAAATALANGSPSPGGFRHFLAPHQHHHHQQHYQSKSANPNGSTSVASSSGGLPSTGSSTPNSMQAGLTSQQQVTKGVHQNHHHHQQQHHNQRAPQHHSPPHHHHHPHQQQHHMPPVSPHHAHLGHSAALAATAAAIAAAHQQQQHHQPPTSSGGPQRLGQPAPAPPPPPASYLHLHAPGAPAATVSASHQSPAVAAAAAAAAAALMSSNQAGGAAAAAAAADASALLYAQQYHEFQYAAMAAAASASQQSILQLADYGAHHYGPPPPSHHPHPHPHAHHHHPQPQHQGPPAPPPLPPTNHHHHQAVAAAAAAVAAAQAQAQAHHHHQQHQQYQRLFAGHQQHQQQHTGAGVEPGELGDRADHSMAVASQHYQAQEQQQQEHHQHHQHQHQHQLGASGSSEACTDSNAASIGKVLGSQRHRDVRTHPYVRGAATESKSD
uniref:Protein held out wings n=1 Tax=Aceria tosichella TaxID=561515 RepID=A0A6G1SF37_9ACAR